MPEPETNIDVVAAEAISAARCELDAHVHEIVQ